MNKTIEKQVPFLYEEEEEKRNAIELRFLYFTSPLPAVPKSCQHQVRLSDIVRG